jgi:hypothetical protein
MHGKGHALDDNKNENKKTARLKPEQAVFYETESV